LKKKVYADLFLILKSFLRKFKIFHSDHPQEKFKSKIKQTNKQTMHQRDQRFDDLEVFDIIWYDDSNGETDFIALICMKETLPSKELEDKIFQRLRQLESGYYSIKFSIFPEISI
jgi:hypothetical protein